MESGGVTRGALPLDRPPAAGRAPEISRGGADADKILFDVIRSFPCRPSSHEMRRIGFIGKKAMPRQRSLCCSTERRGGSFRAFPGLQAVCPLSSLIFLIIQGTTS